MGRPESPHRPQVISARDLPDTTRRLAASRHRAAPLMLASIPGFQPGQVRQHPAPVMGQQPVRGQRPRQPASQPRLVGQHPQQRRPRRASSRLNPARGAPVDHMGGFGNAQRNAVTAAADQRPVRDTSSAPSRSHFVIVSANKLIDRCRACLHLPGRRRETGASAPMADEPPLPGRRPMAGQRMTDSRMAPPPGSRGRYRIDSCAYATPDPVHHASRLRRTRLPHGPPVTTKMPTGTEDRLPIRRFHPTPTGPANGRPDQLHLT